MPAKGHIAKNITPPEIEADVMIERLGNPDKPISQIAEDTGVAKSTAQAIERRIQTRYAELAERARPISRDILERRVCERLDIIDAFLTPDVFLAKLEKTSLKDLGIYEGILLDKLAQIRGAPSLGITPADQGKLDQLAPALLKVLEQRGLTAVATERRIEFKTDGPTGPNAGPTDEAERPGAHDTSSGTHPASNPGPAIEPAEVLQASVQTGAGGTP